LLTNRGHVSLSRRTLLRGVGYTQYEIYPTTSDPPNSVSKAAAQIAKERNILSVDDMPNQEEEGTGGTAPTNLQPGTRRRWVINTKLRPLCSRETQYPLYRMIGGSRDWSGWRGKSRFPAGFDLLTVQRTGIRYSGCAVLDTNK